MVRNLTKGKLVYMSLSNCKALRSIGRKYFDVKTGRSLSYNKAVSLLLEITKPGFMMADNVKNRVLSIEEKYARNEENEDV
jgi:hypothetical protein